MYRHLAAAAAFALTLINHAYADEPAVDLDPVVVTATRTAVTGDQSLASVTVITRKDIERLQPRSVADLLTGLPGISIANNGGLGKSTSVLLRGTADTQVLVLIDGVRLGSATLGTAAFEQIPVDQIERIEIVRGPRSSLYGSEAVGGVIQIFTRKPRERLTPSFSLSGGTYDTWKTQAGLSAGDHRGWIGGSVTALGTKGINATTPDYAGYEPDADGFKQVSGLARAGYRFANGAVASAEWLRAYSHNHYDNSFPSFAYFGTNEATNVQQVLGGTLTLPVVGPWQGLFAASQSEDQESDFGNGNPRSHFDTLRNSVSMQNTLRFPSRRQLTAGIDYLKDHVASDSAFLVTSRENLGLYALYQQFIGRAEGQLSLRNDRNQQFGSHLTGSAALGYAISPSMRLTASYGLGFRAPTFDELYFPAYGNAALRPEKSASGELGLSVRRNVTAWALNVYQTNVRDLIQPVLVDPNTYAYAPENVARARLRGVEGQVTTRWLGWRGTLYLSYVDPRDRTPGTGNHILNRRAQQTARLDLDRAWRRYSLGATVYTAGRRFDDLANTQPMDGYATIDLRTGWQFDARWQLQAQLSNLLDKHYETVRNFHQPGRAVYFTLRYHPLHS